MKTISVDIGGEAGEGITVVIKGCDCRTEDVAMRVVALLAEAKRGYETKDAVLIKKPCGCKDAS